MTAPARVCSTRLRRPLLILGIDGLDWEFIRRNRAALPNLAAWPVLRPLRSIFPPDSIPAWTTIFTGVPPAEHGLLDPIDYLDKRPALAAEHAGSALPGRTFWDEAGRRGQSVVVVNPFLAYPAWPVHGVMVSGPVFVDGQLSVTGASVDELPAVPELGGIVTFPTPATIGPFVEQTLRSTNDQAEFGLKLIERFQPDLAFVNILTIDRLQHFLWRFIDPADPTYPGPNDHADSVLRGYRLVDDLAASYARHGDVIILSDHGHGMRCRRMVYIDEALRRAGLVFETGGGRRTSRAYLIERAKRLALRAGYELALEPQIYSVARRLPNRKSLKYSSFSSQPSRSVAQVSRLFGRNQHSGVDVFSDTPNNRRRVIDALDAIEDPQTGEGVFEWIRERDDVLQGSRVDRYPAVLFKLRDGYGVDFGLYGGLFGPDVNHRRISGGHRPNGVFAASWRCEPPESIEQFYSFVEGLLREHADSARE